MENILFIGSSVELSRKLERLSIAVGESISPIEMHTSIANAMQTAVNQQPDLWVFEATNLLDCKEWTNQLRFHSAFRNTPLIWIVPHHNNMEHRQVAVSLDIDGVLLDSFDALDWMQISNELRKFSHCRQIVEHVNDAIFIHEIGSDGKPGLFTEVNEMACARLGYTREELLRMTPMQIDDPEHQRSAPWVIQSLLTKGELIFQSVHITKSGRKIPVEVSAQVFKHKGKPVIVSITRDVQERGEFEEKLRQRDALLESVGHLAKVGGWDFNVKSHTLTWTDEIFKLLEVDGSYVPHLEDAIRFYEGESRNEIARLVDAAIHKCQPFDARLQLRTAKGNLRWVRTLGRPEVVNDVAIRIYGSFQDITEEVNAQSALLESEQVKGAILNAMPASILFVNPKQEIIWANHQVLTRTGKERSEIHGKTCYSLFANPDHPCESCPTQRAMRSHKMEELVRYTDTGEVFLERSSPVYNHDGKLSGVVEVVQDITKQMEVESRSRQMDKMEAIGRMASGLAHEFNNALFSILGYTEMSLLMAEKESTLATQLHEVQKAATRSRDIVRKLQSFSRQGNVELRPTILNAEVKEAFVFLRAMVPSSIQMDLILSEEPCPILGDAGSIHEILMNLITNAVDAMEQKGNLLLQVSRIESTEPIHGYHGNLSPGIYYQLSIIDTGKGLNSATLQRIFDPFFTTKKAGDGAGLGLPVVFGLMKMHHGIIQVESKENEGTSFHLYFPEALPEVIEQADWGDDIPHGNGESILVVDDEPAVSSMTARCLSLFGYKVQTASHGQEALQMILDTNNHFDLLFTDLTMPHMSGIDLAREVRHALPSLPIILCSGYTHQTNPMELNRLRISKVCLKPIGVKDIVNSVSCCLFARGKDA